MRHQDDTSPAASPPGIDTLSAPRNVGSSRVDGSWRRVVRGLALLAIAPVLAACSDLFSVQGDPNTVAAGGSITLDELMVGATADLYQSYDSKIVWGGLLGDEFNQVGTAPSIIDFDRRMVPTDHGSGSSRENSIGGGFYPNLQRAVFQANQGQELLLSGEVEGVSGTPEDSPEYARLSLYDGLAKTWLADLYCTLAFNGDGPELTSDEAYALAGQEFSEAIGAANVTDAVLQAAYVGRARVRLILGDDGGALSDAQNVDPDFEILATYSTNSFPQRNRVHFRTWDWGNWSVGQNFIDLTIDETGEPDPRVDLAFNPTPAREPTLDLWAPWKVPTASSPLRLASGDEAQYIIAEIEGGQTAVDIINQVRARHGITTEWEPSTSDPDEIRDKVIDERKRTLFLDGVRLGDLRRYIEKFGLDFFETSIPLGQSVGTQTCLPLPDVERQNNPGL